MQTSQNTCSNINVLLGDFINDDEDSAVEYFKTLCFSYSEFSAWIIQFCDIITENNNITFVINSKKLNLANVQKMADMMGEPLEYTNA